MKRYIGSRIEGVALVVVREDNGNAGDRLLSWRTDLRNHSPDGFNWGYCGSGPAQLALALCADALGDTRRALRHYQRVKELLVAGLSGDHWTLTDEEVLRAVYQAEQERGNDRANLSKRGERNGEG